MDELSRGLRELGREVTVLTRGRRRAAFLHDAAHPAKVIRMPGHGWVRRHRLYLTLYSPFLGRVLEDRVVHAATYAVAYPLLRAIERRRARLLVYAHGLEIAEGIERRDPRLEATLRSAAAVIANSRRVAELAAKAGAREGTIAVVPPAIDAARLGPSGPDLRARWDVEGKPVVLVLGRLIERKGQDVLIAALPEIRRRVPDAVLVIAGKGPDEDRLGGIARALGVGHAVRFVGFVDESDLAAAYRSCDVYAMISREEGSDLEGFGITYLEAGACGKPVVAGRSGGTEDAVLEGITGRLVDPASSKEVEEAIVSLLLDPERCRALGERARARVERDLTRAKMAARLAEIGESFG